MTVGRMTLPNITVVFMSLGDKAQCGYDVCSGKHQNTLRHGTSARLPLRHVERYRNSLDLANQRLGRFCQPVGHLRPVSPRLRGSTTRQAHTTAVIQPLLRRTIEMESYNLLSRHLSSLARLPELDGQKQCTRGRAGTSQTMVSVTSRGMDLPRGRRGLIVPTILGKEAKKQYDESQDCKYETRRYVFNKPGEVLLKGEQVLSDIWKRNKDDPNMLNKRLWSVLKHDDIWINGFLKLSGNQGSKTPGLDGLQLADYTLERVMAIKRQVLNGTFRWGCKKKAPLFKTHPRVGEAHPKADGRPRPLTIPDFHNRLVQEVLRRILACIYEPCFNEHSHGFRPGRSCHTALRDVRKNFKGCKWILEGDISSFFDTLSHTTLKQLLRLKIEDDRFISLVYQGLKSKILVPSQGELIHPITGVPQGGVLSPLLSNIYLDLLDKYMAKESKELNVGRARPQSNLYRAAVRRLKSRKAAGKFGLRANDMMSDKFKRMAYVRYADDFIIGLACSRADAQALKNRLKQFLRDELNLQLSETKTLLTDVSPTEHFATRNMASFLGYTIGMHKGVITRTAKRRRKLSEKGHVVIKVDQAKVIQKLSAKGFCTKDGDPRPKFTYLSDTQAVTNAKVNRIFRGIIEYYKLADNIKHFGCRLFYIFSHSLAKLYAAKFRWHRRATIFKIGGRDLSHHIKSKKGGGLGCIEDSASLQGIVYKHYKEIPNPIKAPLNPGFAATFDEIYVGKSQEVQTISELLRKHTISGTVAIGALACIDCGSTEKVNLHHRRSLSLCDDLREKITAKSLRRPVCKNCHLRRHGGSFRKPNS